MSGENRSMAVFSSTMKAVPSALVSALRERAPIRRGPLLGPSVKAHRKVRRALVSATHGSVRFKEVKSR